MQRLFYLLCLGGVLIASGYGLSGRTASNLINPKQTQPGDRISGLEVVATDIYWSPVMGQYFGEVHFRGELTITGTYQSPQTNQNFPCFKVDEHSFNRLPRMAEDNRICVCLTNAEEAKQALSQVEQANKTIAIANYKYIYKPSDYTNSARFIRVVEQRTSNNNP